MVIDSQLRRPGRSDDRHATVHGIVMAVCIVLAGAAAAQPALDIPAETQARLLGQWFDEIATDYEGRIVAYRFEIDGSGQFVGFAEFIGFEEQPLGLSLPITNATADEDVISFDVPGLGSTFEGEFKKDRIVGRAIRSNGGSLRLRLTKGQYVIPYALDVTDEQIEILQGTWVGEIDTPYGINQNIFKFAVLNDGKFHGYLDNPTTGQLGMIIRRLSLEEGQLKLETVYPKGDFVGDISGNDLTGGWRPAGARFSIRAKYRKVD